MHTSYITTKIIYNFSPLRIRITSSFSHGLSKLFCFGSVVITLHFSLESSVEREMLVGRNIMYFRTGRFENLCKLCFCQNDSVSKIS